MPPEISLQEIIAGLKERFLGVEKTKTPIRFVLPSSSHSQQYYTQEFFEALGGEIAPELGEAAQDYLAKAASPNVQVHMETNVPRTVPTHKGEIEIETTGAATIARDYLLNILNPAETPDIKKARKTVLVTTIDQLLASYFGRKSLMGIRYDQSRFPRGMGLEPVNAMLASLKSDESFKIDGSYGRSVNVSTLPVRSDPESPPPRFCMIGPAETDFKDLLKSAKRSSRRIAVHTKRNQHELGVAYLLGFEPERIIIDSGNSEFSASSGYKVIERAGVYYLDGLPEKARGLEFLIYTKEGNVDRFVRETQDNMGKRRDILGVAGIDIIQTGTSIRRNRLTEISQILPVPCVPVRIQLV